MSFTNINHYVPQWYQHRFIDPGQKERKLYYLDKDPERLPRGDGTYYYRDAVRRLGPVSCFQQEHLYTLFFKGFAADVIEKRFFGNIDDEGAFAAEFFTQFKFDEHTERAFHGLLAFMDAQTLRTPKGLDYLKSRTPPRAPRNFVLALMGALHQHNVTVWAEGVWEVLECDDSPTKFIITDHPVTTYNKQLFPGAAPCVYPKDPTIDLLGTHTIFPLSPTRCLVITNLGYARDRHVNPLKQRENARQFGETMIDLRKVQTGRQVPEQHVLAINYTLKTRAKRYVAAGRKEWLYPEPHMKIRHWDRLGGDRFFLMPDARKITFSTDIIVRHKSGRVWGMDEYGRQSREDDPKVKALRDREWRALQAAKEDWEREFGKLSREDLMRYV